MSGLNVLAYQAAILRDQSRHIAITKARRIGGSFVAAMRAALLVVGLRVTPAGLVRVPGEPVIVGAHREDSARELVAEIHRHARALSEAIDPGLVPDAARTLMFETRAGVAVHGLPDSPRAFRSHAGHVVLDEFAFLADPKGTLEAAQPCAGESIRKPDGFTVMTLSTPWPDAYAQGVHDASADLDGRWSHVSRHTIGLARAVADGFPRAMTLDEQAAYLEQRRREVGPDVFAREFDCSWIGFSGGVFSPQLLASARFDAAPGAVPMGRDVLGVDVARSGHLTAVVRVRAVPPGAYALEVRTWRGVSFVDQAARIVELAEGCSEIVVDSTGLGVGLCDILRASGTEARVTPVSFTSQVKSDLVQTTLGALESGRLKLCADRDLMSDLASIEATALAGGAVRFEGSGADGSHGDRAWALMLAARAALGSTPNYTITPGGPPRMSANLTGFCGPTNVRRLGAY